MSHSSKTGQTILQRAGPRDNATQPRGVTSAYRTGEGLNGHTPSYHKEADTLRRGWDWQAFDKALSNSNHPGTQVYEAQRAKGERIDREVHEKPSSRLQIDQLKAERAKAIPAPQLTPNGPENVQSRSQVEYVRERKIHHQERQLRRQQGRAQHSFEAANLNRPSPSVRGPSR